MESFPDYSRIFIQLLSPAWLSSQKTEIAMLRLDLLHPEISGNKWFKLKYNLEAAKRENKNTILTFGGAWSNHISATAAACDLLGFKSIGIIRGGDHENTLTLSRAREHGMQLHFISREQYRKKDDTNFIKQLAAKYNDPYIIPEGGNNAAGIKGCKEILSLCDTREYSHICCAVGTGTTLAGLIEYGCKDKAYLTSTKEIIGFTSLKNGGYLQGKIAGNLSKDSTGVHWKLMTGYHFGGFAKKTNSLLDFMQAFWDQYHIALDFVYTAKMMYGIMDLTGKGYFPAGSRILALHTGGLQGNRSLGLPLQ